MATRVVPTTIGAPESPSITQAWVHVSPVCMRSP